MFIKGSTLYYEVDLQYSYDLEADTTVLNRDCSRFIEVDGSYLWGDIEFKDVKSILFKYLEGLSNFLGLLSKYEFIPDDSDDILLHLYINDNGDCVLDNIVLDNEFIHEGYLINYSNIVMRGETSNLLSDLNISNTAENWIFKLCKKFGIGDIYFIVKGTSVEQFGRVSISNVTFGDVKMASHLSNVVSYSIKAGESSLILIDDKIKVKTLDMNRVIELQDFLIGEYPWGI